MTRYDVIRRFEKSLVPMKYVVTAVVNGRRRDLTKPMTKKDAYRYAKKLKYEMRIAIPKYHWAASIRVGELY